MKKILVLLFLVCIYFFCNSSLAYSEVDAFLKIDGIDGESTVAGHEDEIDILAWSWQMSAPSLNLGAGAGRAIVRPLIVTKYTDKSSPHISLALLNGSHIPNATITVKKSGVNNFDYARIKMTNVQVVNLSPDYNSGTRLLESVALAFSKVCYEYIPQKEDGSSDASIEKCWDLEANKEF